MRAVRTRIDNLLLRGVFSEKAKLKAMCPPLHAQRAWLWTFAEVEGVEPTNNVSDRPLRPAAIWPKLSFGTQSGTAGSWVRF